jgi:hypothetical protein
MARRASGRSRVRRRWIIGATVVAALALAVVLTALGFRGAAAWRSGRIFLQEATFNRVLVGQLVLMTKAA